MAQGAPEPRGGPAIDAQDLLARAAAAAAHERALGAATARDLAIPESLRLDERTRAAMRIALDQIVAAIEASLRRAVVPEGFPGIGPTLPLLHAAELAADPALVHELLARIRLDQLAAGLPHRAADHSARPSLLNRLAEHPAPELSEAARALLLAESRARSPEAGRWRLPLTLHRRLLWWVASAMREQAGTLAGVALDEALCAAVAAECALAERCAEEEVEAVALRLAAAIAPEPREHARVLLEALRDRHLPLFLALLARAGDIAFADARALLLDPGAERLLLVLHALDVPREAIAELCFLLSDADPRRDLAALADTVDMLAAIEIAKARDLLAELRLPAGYREARAALRGIRAR
ncbi:hypothetical protein SAMN03159338_2136 [Sphingomonas sp. NFR04]|uniref:DUF2336 domain-containing protein n=1 Tax=Sphingomonas sp. NFR04 TaxID=1566283 RepID=UPI0008E88D64|nr:DUF2336 domain-containing protein [Sphingomonas sp. NFR04]SFJ67424.1 hypothetical protein SAMN03159338_2136 [Sphingomonas sp. NFR04]